MAASYVRNLYLGVRIEDRATRPLRRIAADFRALGRQGLAMRQQVAARADISARSATAARVRAQAELQSLQTGSRAITLEKQKVALSKSALMAEYKRLGVSKQAEQLTARQLRNSAQLGMYAQGFGFPKGAPPGSKARQQLLNAARAEQRAISIAQTQLASTTGIAAGALTAQTLEEQRLIAVEGERIAREAALTTEIETRVAAEELAIQKSVEAQAAVARFPVDRLKGIAQYVRHIGSVLTVMGAVAVSAFALAAKGAADFATQVTVAATQSTSAGKNSVMQVQKNAAFIQTHIQAMLAHGKVIANPKEQTDAIYQIFSGITFKGSQLSQLKQGIQLLKEFNRVTTANVGLVTLEESTKAGIILMNDFGYSTKNVRSGLNIMQAAVRFGRMTMSEFIGTLNQAAPAAKSAGYNFTAMSSTIAFLSRKFPQLRQAATGYARLTELFAKEPIISGLKQQGVDIVNDTGKLRPLNTIMEMIVKQFPQLKKGSVYSQNFFKTISGAQATGSFISARRVFTMLAQDVPGYDNMIKRVTQDHNELRKSLIAAQKSPGVRWMEFTNQLKGLALEIGAGVLPVVAKLAGQFGGLANWFNGLSTHTKQAIGYFGAFIAAATLVSGIILTIGGAIFTASLALGVFGGAETAAAASTGILASEMGIAAPEFVIAAASIAGLIYLYRKYPKQAHEVIDYTKKIVKELFGLDYKLLQLTAKPWKVLLNIDIKFPKGVSSFFKKHMSKPLQDALNIIPGGKVVTSLYDLWKNIHNKGNIINKLGTIPSTRNALDERRQFPARPHLEAMKKAADAAAESLGTQNTKAFQKAYDTYVKAVAYAKAHPTDFLAQLREANAATALQAVATKQQYAAAQKAASALAKGQKKFSDQFIINEAKKVAALSKTARSTKTFAAWKAYYAALDKLQTNATSSQLQTVEKLFNLTDSSANKVTANATKAANKIKQTYQQVLQNLQTMYQTFYQQNQNAFGQLFNGPWMQSAAMQDRLQYGNASAGLRRSDLLKDLKSQVTQFARFRRQTDSLIRRGLPTDLVNQIRALGPEQAGEQVKLLNKMTPAQIKQYGKLWKQGQKEIHAATMRDLNNQLQDWKKHGRRIALAIAAGLRDENTALEKALRAMITKAFPSLAAKNLKTPARNSPHKVTSTGTSGPKEHHDHLHVHMSPTHGANPSIKKQVSDANWHHRTRQK